MDQEDLVWQEPDAGHPACRPCCPGAWDPAYPWAADRPSDPVAEVSLLEDGGVATVPEPFASAASACP